MSVNEERASRSRLWRSSAMTDVVAGAVMTIGALSNGLDYEWRGASWQDAGSNLAACRRGRLRFVGGGRECRGVSSGGWPRSSGWRERRCGVKTERLSLAPQANPVGLFVLDRPASEPRSGGLAARPSESSAVSSAVLYVGRLLPVCFGDCLGQLAYGGGQFAEGASHCGEADALKRAAEVFPRVVELRP
jgi:hypothetical protein